MTNKKYCKLIIFKYKKFKNNFNDKVKQIMSNYSNRSNPVFDYNYIMFVIQLTPSLHYFVIFIYKKDLTHIIIK